MEKVTYNWYEEKKEPLHQWFSAGSIPLGYWTWSEDILVITTQGLATGI